MLVNGDKLVVTKKVNGFLEEGDIVKVINVNENGMISFAFGESYMHKGLMNTKEYEEHFKKYEEPKAYPTVTEKMIDDILTHSKITVDTIYDKCAVVTCKLPNGFVIVESSACVSPENYDEEMGIDICMNKITDKIWELEGYRLQEETYRRNKELDELDSSITTASCDCNDDEDEEECDCEECEMFVDNHCTCDCYDTNY